MIEKEKRKISTEIFTVMSYLLLCVKKMKESYDKAISSDEISFETETELYFYEDMFYQNVYVFFEKLALYIELSLPEEVRKKIKKEKTNDKKYEKEKPKTKKEIRMEILREFAKIDKEFSELISSVYEKCEKNDILKKRNDFTHKYLGEKKLSEIRALFYAMLQIGTEPDEESKEEKEKKVENSLKQIIFNNTNRNINKMLAVIKDFLKITYKILDELKLYEVEDTFLR